MNNSQTFSKFFLKFFLSFIQCTDYQMCSTACFFRNTVKGRGKYTFIIYKHMETEGEMREERSERSVFRAEKAWMQAGKREEIKRKIFLQD